MSEIKKVFWSDVRNIIENLNPVFFELVDKLSPDNKFPMYLVDYGYGDLVGDDEGIFLPTKTGQYVRLDSDCIPRPILSDLGYGLHTSPLGMFFDKSFEWFLTTIEENTNKTYPVFLDFPGTFFSINHILNFGVSENHLPNGVLFVTAGSKSNFMIPKISCGAMHSRLQKQYNITSSAPISHYEHSAIFSQIIKSLRCTYDWTSTILYFSEAWVKTIINDPVWKDVKSYFYATSNQRSSYAIHSDYYNHVYRVTNKRNNLKSNFLIYDTARHLFEILLGVKLGFAPAVDDSIIPLSIIKEAYSECYKLQYEPLVAVPSYFNYSNPEPVYYSLQYPSLSSSPKARNASTNISDLIALIDVVHKYQKDFSLPIRECKNTFLEKVSKAANFKFYHSLASGENSSIQSPDLIPLQDKRFKGNKDFPINAGFFKGCISIFAD